MNIEFENKDRENMTPEEKKIKLYLDQKNLLDTFLEHGTITKAQYDKSFGDLTIKMGMEEYSGLAKKEK